MTEPQGYAGLSWTIHDVLTVRPDMTDEQAERFLNSNENYIRDRLTELGWDVIDTLLDMDGYTTNRYGEPE